MYVVEVWAGDKRLAVTHRRYSEFDELRKQIKAAMVAHVQPSPTAASRQLALSLCQIRFELLGV